MMNRKGFTLVELMVVLAILGLLAAVGVPQYLKTLERAQTSSDAAKLAQVQSAFNIFKMENNYSAPAADTTLVTTLAGTDNILTAATGDGMTFAEYWDGPLPTNHLGKGIQIGAGTTILEWIP